MNHRRRTSVIVLLCMMIAAAGHAQIISTFPHSEGFESFAICTNTCGAVCMLSGGWVNDTTDQTDWTTYSGATPTSNTGPDADHTLGTTAGKYLYVEAS